jgi:peptide/nickel transport system permease protein
MSDMPHAPDQPVPSPTPSAFRRFTRSDIVWSFKSSPVTIVASLVALVLILMAVLAPWVAPYNPFNPATLSLMDGFTPPNSTALSGRYYALGTDSQGRDVLSTIMYGSRVSLFVGFSATLFAMVLGVSMGLVAGYRGGIIDAVIMRIASLPSSSRCWCSGLRAG